MFCACTEFCSAALTANISLPPNISTHQGMDVLGMGYTHCGSLLGGPAMTNATNLVNFNDLLN